MHQMSIVGTLERLMQELTPKLDTGADSSSLTLREVVCEVNLSKAVGERLSPVSENSGIGDAINPVNGKLKAPEKVECGLTECALDPENRGRWKKHLYPQTSRVG